MKSERQFSHAIENVWVIFLQLYRALAYRGMKEGYKKDAAQQGASSRRRLLLHSDLLILATFWLSSLSMSRVLAPVTAASYSPAATISTIRRVVVVGGTHGNEYTGVWCIKALEAQRSSLERLYPSLQINTLLANPAAHLENKRFIHTDLNREFSIDKLGPDAVPSTDSVEAMRARQVDAMLGPKFASNNNNNGDQHDDGAADLIVDLHSTTSNMGITLIIHEGDAFMAQAAAYVMMKVCAARVLMHVHPTHRFDRQNLSSVARHAFTIEVGPVPQGVLRHDAVENTQLALAALLEFLQELSTTSSSHEQHQDNDGPKEAGLRVSAVKSALHAHYAGGFVSCYKSAPAVRPGELSGKIPWPKLPTSSTSSSDVDETSYYNPNFPSVLIHKSVQDRDFSLIHKGDPLFVAPDGTVIPYDGSHGNAVYLTFVNEGGYYYPSSGAGIGVAVASRFSLDTGRIVENEAVVSVPVLDGHAEL
jgi:succinylglutamate desuccinylase